MTKPTTPTDEKRARLKGEGLQADTDKALREKAEGRERKDMLNLRLRPSYVAVEARREFKLEIALIKK